MKTVEIILILVIFIAGFVLADYLASQVMVPGNAVRLVVRLVLLCQIIALIYLVFDGRDSARRIKQLENVLRDEGKLPAEDAD